MGFPSGVLFKFVNSLLEYNFHVIVIDQTTQPPNPKRHITGIYSPATFIDRYGNENTNNVEKSDSNINKYIFIIKKKIYKATI